MEGRTDDLAVRLSELEACVRRYQMMVVLLLLVAASVFITSCSQLFAAQARAGDSPGILRARGLVITDARGRERIILGAPVPSAPLENGPRISPATGMIILDENGRERFGLGHREDDWMAMGFDAAPGRGTGANRERLHIGVDNEGHGFIRYLDSTSGLAGRLHLNEQNRVALELWHGDPQTRTFERGVLDMAGWRRLPDYHVEAQSR